MDPDNVACAYCGNAMTEWDHLNPLVMDKQATGFITEIQHLVPACGKCNQTNGNRTDYLFDPRKLEVGQSYPLEETSLSRRDR